MHEIWIEQCDAAQNIKLRYGLKAAFDYVVAEKLLKFAGAASDHPEFARELPRFISRVRRMFTTQEMRTHITRIEREQIEREQSKNDIDVQEHDEVIPESPAAAAERARQFATIKELLTATDLGTS